MDAAVVILDSPQKISAARRSYERPRSGGEEDDTTIPDDFSFSFSFPSSTTATDLSAAVADADEIFSDGRILPVFNPTFPSAPRTRAPLWKLMMAPSPTRSLSWSSDCSSNLEAEGDYCIWPRPPPEMRLKSSSTGSSSSRRCRLGLLLARCHSLGSDRFSFLHPAASSDEIPNPNPNPNPRKNTAVADSGGKGLNLGPTAEMDIVTAHRLYYAKASNRRVTGSKRSPVPYKPIGLLANINGMFRSRLPV